MADGYPHTGRDTRRARLLPGGRILAAACVALALGACGGIVQEEIDKARAELKPGKGELSSPESLMRIAEHTSRGGDPHGAIIFYHRASLADPDNPEPIVRMAELMTRLGAPRDAEAAYNRALSIDPENVVALLGLGNVLVTLDRPKAAIAYYHAALKIERDPRAIGGLGVALDMSGRHAAAQENYRAGLAEFPASLALRNNLGLSLALAGQTEEAIKLLREVATHPSATSRHRQNLALAYGLAGKPELAAEMGRLDLEADDVRQNLDYYSWLRAQTRTQAAESLGDDSNDAVAPPPAKAPNQAEAPILAPRDIRTK